MRPRPRRSPRRRRIDGAGSPLDGWADQPVGGLSFHERSIAAGIGYSWGRGADLTIGGGEGGVVMQNQHGVVLRVRATTEGVDAKLAVEGLTIELE